MRCMHSVNRCWLCRQVLGRDTNVALNCTKCVAMAKQAVNDVRPRELRLPSACLSGWGIACQIIIPDRIPLKACMQLMRQIPSVTHMYSDGALQTSNQQQMAAPLGFGGAQMGLQQQQQQQPQQQQQGLGAMLPHLHQQQQQQGLGAMLPQLHQQHFMPPTSLGSGGSHMSHPALQGPDLGLLQRGPTPEAAAQRLLQEFGMGQPSLPQQQGMPRSSFAAAAVQQVPVSGTGGGSSSGASHPQQLAPPGLADLLVHAASDDLLNSAVELEERVGRWV